VNDSKRLEQVLKAIAVSRPMPTARRSKHLCADAGYRGAELQRIIEWHGYIPHVVDRRQESNAKRRHPGKKARRWVVEVCHSWFNRFRKLLVRYEKLERSFMALNHLAAAIIAFRKVPASVNIIYGYVLSSNVRPARRPACHRLRLSSSRFLPPREFRCLGCSTQRA
jgi:transposase